MGLIKVNKIHSQKKLFEVPSLWVGVGGGVGGWGGGGGVMRQKREEYHKFEA